MSSSPARGTASPARWLSHHLAPGQLIGAVGFSVPPGSRWTRSARSLPADGAPRSLRLGDHDYRVVAVRAADGDVLVTGLPLAGLNETVTRLSPSR